LHDEHLNGVETVRERPRIRERGKSQLSVLMKWSRNCRDSPVDGNRQHIPIGDRPRSQVARHARRNKPRGQVDAAELILSVDVYCLRAASTRRNLGDTASDKCGPIAELEERRTALSEDRGLSGHGRLELELDAARGGA
jgi:hypothetical protein